MKALDRAGSLFLRSILKRMKALGLNQSALARRMNVSRAYVSKVFAGDVNISFQTACRFAKALEMDFMPGLAAKGDASGKKEGLKSAVLAALCLSALFCQAEVALVPTWLPEDQRFEVAGTSNEIAQIERTLAAMRDAFHPKLIEMMRRGDSATNGCPSAMGPTLAWIVHVSLPAAATNETVYFNSYKDPLPAAAFGDFALLTNRAARLSYLPPAVNLSLVFDDGKKNSVSRAIPGVDYPGVSYEDEGSTPNRIQLVLRAPKSLRQFHVRTDAVGHVSHEVEFVWVALKGLVGLPKGVRKSTGHSATELFGICYGPARRGAEIAVFAREKGRSWGVASRISVSADNDVPHCYANGKLSYIDYGDFRDWYALDERDRILGFTRVPLGQVHGERYSNRGELIVETYPDDKPKTTRKVKYSVVDGKLTYEVLEGDIHYKNDTMTFPRY